MCVCVCVHAHTMELWLLCIWTRYNLYLCLECDLLPNDYFVKCAPMVEFVSLPKEYFVNPVPI